MISYQELEHRFGEIVAYSLLLDMEQYLRINSAAAVANDLDDRLQKAFAAMKGPLH